MISRHEQEEQAAPGGETPVHSNVRWNPSVPRAGEYFRRAIDMYQTALGPETPDLIPVLEDYAALLRLRRRDNEAASMRDRVKQLRLKTFE